MRRPSCGQEKPEEASFCNSCGSRIEAACAKCGRTNLPGSSFCNGSGSKLTGAGPATGTPTPTPVPGLPAAFAGGGIRYNAS